MSVVPAEAYSWDYLRRLAYWSVPMGVVVAGAGALLTHDVGFAVACLGATALDVAFLFWIVSRARTVLASGTAAGAGTVAALIGIRLALKAVLLVAAASLPALVSFAGMVAGVLVVDTTILVVGGVAAVVHGLRGTGPLAGGR